MVSAAEAIAGENAVASWKGFTKGLWQKQIDVRDFIQQNYRP